ncbi:MAG: hypothetical protein OEM41_08755, partial [Ignavibacteria bacterium]|nr:hypothetical protein [Ignavibacteria bacterium]
TTLPVMSHRRMHATLGVLALVAAGILQGCIFVRTTDHRILFQKDGSGEGIMRLIDIRSDASSEQDVREDFDMLMKIYLGEGLEQFENAGRRITSKNLIVSGDTLTAEIRYGFTSRAVLGEMRATNEEMFVVIPADKVIGRTNGQVESFQGNARRIVWDVDVRRITYRISEKTLPKSVSLAPLYLASQGRK